MKTKNLISFIQSLVILPVMAMPVMFVGIGSTDIAQSLLAQKFNIEADGKITFNQAIDPELAREKIIAKIKADAIDAYFESHDMPLAGTGMKMVQEAESNDIDWRLIPAIAVRESTGGKFDCKKVGFNPFGWGSCKIGFKSTDDAIETVAKNLGGNNPRTAYYYDNKTVKQILRAYNPPSIVPRYAQQVISIMNTIGPENMTLPDTDKTVA